jgi:SAM-dependent methyltransferase
MPSTIARKRTSKSEPARVQTGGGERDVYAQPLVYDIIHTPGTREEVAAMVRIAGRVLPDTRGRFNASRALWLEPACGTGRCVRELARRGGACVGVDIEPGMVEFAQSSLASERAALMSVLVGDMRKMDSRAILSAIAKLCGREPLPVVAFCPHNSIRHLPTDGDMIVHLRSTADVLRRFGGIYLVGIGLSGPGGEGACETVHTASRRGVHVREIIDFVPPDPAARGAASRREHAYKHITVTSRGQESDFTSAYVLRTYTSRQWSAVVRAAGMREIAVVGPWGETFDSTRLHYAYRVLAPAPVGEAGSRARSVRSKKSPMRRSASN